MELISTIEETKQAITEALHFAAICAAQKIGIDKSDLLSPQELHSILQKKSPELFEALEILRDKYNQWCRLHEGVPIHLSQAQAHTDLEAARNVFLKALQQV